MSKIAVISDPLFKRHENDPGHPESPDRIDAVGRGISSFDGEITPIAPRLATREEIAPIHAAKYIESLAATAARDRTFLDPDTQTNRYSFETALSAAGSAIVGVDAILAGEFDSVFCAVRPPGHHAESTRAMGFCLINNAAVAAARALQGGHSRIAIVDWDVHHGNGTMHSFYGSTVLYMSVHQSPHFPGTGSLLEIGDGRGLGFTVNAPLGPGAGNEDYLEVVAFFVSILNQFGPELLIISAGYDSHYRDRMSSHNLTSDVYSELTNQLRVTRGLPTIILLEGGYDAIALEEGTRSTLEGLAGGRRYHGNPGSDVHENTREVVRRLREALSPYWSL